ncbi:ATP-binding protein [Vibrio parahaemolyticus]
MLLEFGFYNFFSFKEGGSISFRLPSQCPEEISLGKDYTNVICVKGKNGSGKTNVLKALSFMFDFATDSFSNKPDQRIMVEPFYETEADCEFYAEFLIQDVEYRYELSLNKQSVTKESLHRKVQRWTKIIERTGEEFTHLSSGYKKLSSMKLRDNASFISTFNQYDVSVTSDLKEVYYFFHYMLSNVTFFGLNSAVQSPQSIESISKNYYENPETFKFVKEIICKCDTGVSDIQIRTMHDESTNATKYYPLFIHEVNGEEHFLTHFTESSGTKSLFVQLGKYALAARMGGVLCLDEFDINLHPYILPVLVNLFLDPETNVGQGQFIFTTHNNEILDDLGRYRTYIVDKDDNQSYCYRLDEIPGDILRNDRPITTVYRQGKIGGIPRL